MSKKNTYRNELAQKVLDDLESFLNFCREYGYVYDEKNLYSQKSFEYRQFQKFLQGKPCKDNWAIHGDLKH